MIERERKYRIDSAEATRLSAFLEGAAALDRVEVQDNVHFSERGVGRGGMDLRLRTVSGQRELTLKGPRLDSGPSKIRDELTVMVSGDIEAMLAALGYERSVSYRKRTAVYAFRRAIVSVDEVDGLGRFCEVEAPDDEVIDDAVRALGLDPATLEARGYARLVKDAVRSDQRAAGSQTGGTPEG